MLGAQAEGVQAEVLGNPTFSLRPKSLQPIYLNRYRHSRDEGARVSIRNGAGPASLIVIR
jgi:hypothetical protein